MLKATRFMRQPFFVAGFKVTLENMDAIAKWCQGHVVEDGENSFVRVPVDRATSRRQTEAYVGTWVLLSKQRGGTKSFKVYQEEFLLKNFYELPEEDDVYLSEDLPPSEEKIPPSEKLLLSEEKTLVQEVPAVIGAALTNIGPAFRAPASR